ncbi:hypothetical protein FGU65_02560 [Methanoculleus sp. FWC-SCC1]|uniref:Uncharacterized protein n=1 Tax=Methanoculleus frigidifontis TaxID=2584085 RepID=A0ABT8M777_9EURY|nr:hypothetical protein [Methanoculleus sp. FWC-SCC1]MDN7023788.1 hypothetical protein [Methanoculleus sp. FWC-SCC1]
MSTDAVERIEAVIGETYANGNLLIETLRDLGFTPWSRTKSDAVLLAEEENLALFLEFDPRDGICRKYVLCGLQPYANQRLGFVPESSLQKLRGADAVPAAPEPPILQAGEKGRQIKETIRALAKTNVLGLARISQVIEESPYPEAETETLLQMLRCSGEVIEAQQGWLRVVGS